MEVGGISLKQNARLGFNLNKIIRFHEPLFSLNKIILFIVTSIKNKFKFTSLCNVTPISGPVGTSDHKRKSCLKKNFRFSKQQLVSSIIQLFSRKQTRRGASYIYISNQ